MTRSGQSQTRTDSGGTAPTEPGPGERWAGAGRDRAPRCRPASGPRRTRSEDGEAGDPPHGSLSGRGTGAGRRVSDVQRCRKSLFCGEGLGIGRSDCGPYRRFSAVDLRRRRPDRDGGPGSWHNGPGTPARGLKRRGRRAGAARATDKALATRLAGGRGRPGHVFRCFRLRRRRRCARCYPRPGWGRWGGEGGGEGLPRPKSAGAAVQTAPGPARAQESDPSPPKTVLRATPRARPDPAPWPP